ncbi:hypothetical protein CUMW_010300 [Citrus unshiu]|nr:hypothetical protein CUMW_010300 [Citrus unshiu]
MPPLKFFMFSLFLMYLLSFQFSFTAAVDREYVRYDCSTTANFTRNSTYEKNLNLLLSSIPTNASRGNGFSSGFFNATAGQDPNRVYGLFLCRGDQTTSGCQDCVTLAASDVIQLCPVSKETIIWYAECLLRYSDQSIFSTMATAPTVSLLNTQNVTDQGRLNELVGTQMSQVVTQAVNNTKRFATRKANFTTFQTLYSLAQCTPDLSSSDCNTCLRGAVARLPSCCSGKQGGRVLTPPNSKSYNYY